MQNQFPFFSGVGIGVCGNEFGSMSVLCMQTNWPVLLQLDVVRAQVANPVKTPGTRCPYIFNGLAGDQEIVVHTPGLMLGGYITPGREILVQKASGTQRRSTHNLVALRDKDVWIGVNPSLANDIMQATIEMGLIDCIKDSTNLKREVKLGSSRYDFCVDSFVIEVKSSSFCVGNIGVFPLEKLKDLDTNRTYKHPTSSRMIKQVEYMNRLENPLQGLVCVVLQRSDCASFQINPLDTFTNSIMHTTSCKKLCISVEWTSAGVCYYKGMLGWGYSETLNQLKMGLLSSKKSA